MLAHKVRHLSNASLAPSRFATEPDPTLRFYVLGCRLLLGRAMNCAESPNKIPAVNTHHIAIGKKLGEEAKRDPVLGVTKGRNEDGSVGDVEVRITCRQTLPAKPHGRGKGQFNDIERLTILIASLP